MNRYVQSLFCDDIRYETGNKVSYMGVYGNQLFVPVFPVLLPKLCIAVSIVTPIRQPFKQLTFRLFRNDEVLNDTTFPGANLEAQSLLLLPAQEVDLVKTYTFSTTFILSSLAIEEPCTLKVYAETEEETIPGVGLRVQQLQNS